MHTRLTRPTSPDVQFREPADVFSVASALYRQALCKAHTLAPDAYPSPAFPGLVACFESILQVRPPRVVSDLTRVSP